MFPDAVEIQALVRNKVFVSLSLKMVTKSVAYPKSESAEACLKGFI